MIKQNYNDNDNDNNVDSANFANEQISQVGSDAAERMQLLLIIKIKCERSKNNKNINNTNNNNKNNNNKNNTKVESGFEVY